MACGCGCKDGSCDPRAAPVPDSGCGCEPAARPLPPSFVGAPGIPEPLSRFDVAEQMRRQGFPLAMPQGWNGQRIPTFLHGSTGPRPDGGVVTQRRKPAPADLPLSPDFFDQNQRRSRARLGEFEILSPHRDARAREHVSNDTQVPFGEQFQCERFEPAASPLGAVIDCDETFLSWTAPPDRPATEEPPQATPRTEPIPLDPALRAEVIDRIRTEAAATKIPPAPPEPAATSPDGTQAPEQAESMDDGACAASPDWLSPPVAPGSGGGDPDLPTPSPGGGGGGEGGGEEPYGPLRVVALWKDPCPCHCFCFPLGWLFPIFATFSGLVLGVGRLLQPDRSNLGVSDAWRPTPVIGPPDGFVDQLILEARQPPPPTYASPPNVAAGSAGLSDGHSPDVVHHVSSPVSQPRLLVAGLSQLGEPALRGTLPVPVGPGPGIPGIGSQPFFPADGSRFEAAPGAIFAGLAPATRGVGFGEFGERTALRPDRNGDVDREP